jgi:predicted GNAT family acetyltransferase
VAVADSAGDAADAAEATDAADAVPVVTDNPAESRYELHLGGELAGFVMYHLRGSHQINLIHTEIEPRFQGAGLATHLARFSLDDARKRHLAVLPSCPYIRSWIRKHPDYADLVPANRRAEFGL